jgi:molecular chaperone GrpE
MTDFDFFFQHGSGQPAGGEPAREPVPSGGPAPEEPRASDAPPAAKEDPTTTLTRERDEYLDMVRRVQAEFENYKKRVMRQQTEHLERAAESLVVKLLPALDTLDLARSHHDQESEAGAALAQVASAWNDALEKEGLQKIDPLGQAFDPNEAEAVMHEPADDGGSVHEVVEVLRPGYRWRGRVLRPAMVKVKG